VAGLSPKEVAVEFLLTQTGADGIVSTKPILIKKAKEMGKIGILRAFIIDSSAFETMKWQLKTLKPDAVELMPGIIPSIFSEMKSCTEIPVIATGLIRDRQDAITAFEAGVDGVSSSNHTIWFLEQV
jgi:glycerol-3-phosphate responsive antiterminator